MKRLIFLLSFATLAMISTAQTHHPYPDQKASPPGITRSFPAATIHEMGIRTADLVTDESGTWISFGKLNQPAKVMELKSDGTLHIYDINQVKAIAINGRIYKILPPTLEDVTDKPTITVIPGTGITFTPDGTIHGLSFPADPLKVDTSRMITRSRIIQY